MMISLLPIYQTNCTKMVFVDEEEIQRDLT